MAQTVGEILQQARQKRGLTIDQVSQAIHVRKHFLEAIEADRRSDLPSAVQGRGFLRLYAGHLDLPVAPLLAAWDGKAPVEPAAPAVQPAEAPGDGTPAAETTSDEAAPLEPERPSETPVVDPLVFPLSSRAELEQLEPGQPQFVPVNDYPVQDTSGEAGSVFAEIGQKLRAQRESLGISLAEVERYTRLRQHYLRALEAGDINSLPSPVQGRGMLSNYAAFLNMDEDKLLLRFAEGLQMRRVERMPRPEPQALFNSKKRPARQAPGWRRFLTPDLVFGVGMAVIILTFVLWTAARVTTLRGQEAEPTTPAIAEILLTPDEMGTQSGTTVAGASAGEGTPSDEGTPAAVGTPSGEELPLTEGTPGIDETPGAGLEPGSTLEGATFEAPLMNGTPTPGVLAEPPDSSAPLQLYIVAKQRAWLQVSVDNTVKFNGRVVPGNAYDFTGEKRIELVTGNAAALQVFFNQRDLGTLGITAQVANLVLLPEGIQTPTPAFPPTALPTELPTITLQPSMTPQATPTVTPFVPD